MGLKNLPTLTLLVLLCLYLPTTIDGRCSTRGTTVRCVDMGPRTSKPDPTAEEVVIDSKAWIPTKDIFLGIFPNVVVVRCPFLLPMHACTRPEIDADNCECFARVSLKEADKDKADDDEGETTTGGSYSAEDVVPPPDKGTSSSNVLISGWLALKATVVIISHTLAEQMRELKAFEFLAWGGGVACLGLTAGGIVCFVRIRHRHGTDVTCCLTIPSPLTAASVPGLSGDVDLTGLSTRMTASLDSALDCGEHHEMLEISASPAESQIIDSSPSAQQTALMTVRSRGPITSTPKPKPVAPMMPVKPVQGFVGRVKPPVARRLIESPTSLTTVAEEAAAIARAGFGRHGKKDKDGFLEDKLETSPLAGSP